METDVKPEGEVHEILKQYEEDFKNYLRCVRELTIDGTAVNPKRVKVIDGEGRLDLSAPLFKERSAVTVRAAGYPDLSFEAARR